MLHIADRIWHVSLFHVPVVSKKHKISETGMWSAKQQGHQEQPVGSGSAPDMVSKGFLLVNRNPMVLLTVLGDY